ncbi:hypothetical protein DACRYDRAFT_16884 [Dacryopinax primogenitus]|uniref:Uncharacterized protein n=1 Tax=Dacryopinax primogenitus (strain DJM 731) TaxID=1858805 RepID=M5G9E4_DACPD|nr:uncharacterized protein DACRYDRAFT_16884 [Dacryopinax primogenitus]EJU00413.1 hypothetical protein DACRYDRAFT_16884 [Dacryopinax primogenitus]
MWWRHLQNQTNRVLVAAAVIIFICTSTDVLLECHRLLVGLIYTDPSVRDAYFNSSGDWKFCFQVTVRLMNMLTGDAVMIYRVWAAWERRWQFILFNTCVWLVTFASTIRLIQIRFSWAMEPTNLSWLPLTTTWSLVLESTTLAQVLTATSLVAFRIWKVDRAAAKFKGSSLLPVVGIVVESGLLYTSLTLVNVTCTALVNPGFYVVLQLMSPIIGITFSLIIVRVGLKLGSGSTKSFQATFRTELTPSRQPRSMHISVHRHFESEHQDTIEDEEQGSAFGDGQESFSMKPVQSRTDGRIPALADSVPS